MKTTVPPGRSYIVSTRHDTESICDQSERIDQMRVESDGLPVKELRAITSRVIETPFGTTRTLAFFEADRLTPILQTTLLKLIEEPPVFLRIVLQTQRPDALLSTIRSRCHVMPISATRRESSQKPTLDNLILKNRQEAIATLEQLRNYYLNPGKINAEALDILDRSIRKLERNCNVKLTLDYFLLRYQAL